MNMMNILHNQLSRFPNIRPTDEAAFEKAADDVYEIRERIKAKELSAKLRWEAESRQRGKTLPLLGQHSGAIDTGYVMETPFTLGYNLSSEGPKLAYVALGGVDVMDYLPPDILQDIEYHIQSDWEDTL